MSKVTALISDERPVIRIYGGDTDDHVEIQFETKSDANVAVERLNELFKTATGLTSPGSSPTSRRKKLGRGVRDYTIGAVTRHQPWLLIRSSGRG